MATKKEKPTTTEMVAKANSLFTIANEIQMVVEEIIENGGECPDETFNNLQEWKAALEVKAENIGFVKQKLDHEIERYKELEEIARFRRQSMEKAQDRLKRYLRDCMIAADMKKIKKDLFSFSVVAGRTKAVIQDEKKLPFDLVEIVEVTKPNTKEIKARLEAGEEIPGARLETGEDYLMIRGK